MPSSGIDMRHKSKGFSNIKISFNLVPKIMPTESKMQDKLKN